MKRDEWVDGVVYAAAEMVRAFGQEHMAEHLLRVIGTDKRGAQPDESRLVQVRRFIREHDEMRCRIAVARINQPKRRKAGRGK